MWKIVAVAVLSSGGTALWMQSQQAEPTERVDPATVDMCLARIADLESQVSASDAALLKGLPHAPVAPDAPASERLRRLEERIQALEAPDETRATNEPERVRPGDEDYEETPAERRARIAAEAKRELDRARSLAVPARFNALHNIAKRKAAEGSYAQAESLLREIVSGAGTRSSYGQEAAYQIGWVRDSARDFRGARKAWLEASRHYDTRAVRFENARFYAANAAAKSGDKRTAVAELRVIALDVEREGLKNKAYLIEMCAEHIKRLEG